MKSTSNSKGETKTSPFIIEKAVHNIMFIKHHMKAQDEFDAVSTYIDLALCEKPKNLMYFHSRNISWNQLKLVYLYKLFDGIFGQKKN